MSCWSTCAIAALLCLVFLMRRQSSARKLPLRYGCEGIDPAKSHFTAIEAVKEDFQWDKTAEVPYRPWRNGPYYIEMGLKNMKPETWTEIDMRYLDRMKYKQWLFANHREDVLQALPDTLEPSFEALYLLIEFLSSRYPMMFRRTEAGILNLVTSEVWDLRRTSKTWESRHPLEIMSLLTTEDWFIMQPNESDGNTYHLRAGAVCFPAGWKIKERIGKSLWGIHAGRVPFYEEKLALSMDRFFSKLRVGNPVQRFNYAIDKSPELWHIEPHHHLGVDPNVKIENLHLRVERQVLRRLPLSKAMVFSIRTYVTPMSTVTEDLEVANALRTNIATYTPDVAKYKNKQLWNPAVTKHLDEILKDYIQEN